MALARSLLAKISATSGALLRPIKTTSASKCRNLVTLSGGEMGAFKNLLPDLIQELTFEGEHKDMLDVNPHLSKVSAAYLALMSL